MGNLRGGMNFPWLPAKGSVAVGRGKYVYTIWLSRFGSYFMYVRESARSHAHLYSIWYAHETVFGVRNDNLLFIRVQRRVYAPTSVVADCSRHVLVLIEGDVTKICCRK